MPLLGKKVFSLATNSRNGETDDAPYLIPHTKERFQLKSEYKKRKDLYSQNIWTCRATGHTNLTHEEAFKSEKVVMEQLASQFPKCYEKDVLELVHHSTASLEVIVDKAWWKLHQQFIIGEKVNLKVKVADKLIPAKVITVDSSAVDRMTASSTSNSSSSDKENSADEKDKEQSPKKWIPPKFLPYTYSIELDNEAKVIHSVPANDMDRVTKVPSKDMLRHFVHISALRSGTAPTSPWVVNADLVKQYKLISKFADFFLSPVKMPETFKKAKENDKKRKSSSKPQNATAKKLKLDKSADKSKKDKPLFNNKVKNKIATPPKKDKTAQNDSLSNQKKKSPSKKSSIPPNTKINGSIVVCNSDSEDGVSSHSKLKRTSSLLDADSDSDVPLYQLVDQTTPKKKKKTKNGDDGVSDKVVPLNKTTSSTPKKSTPKKMVNGMASKQSSPSKGQKKNDKSVTKKVNSLTKNKNEKKKGKKLSPQKGGMKQVTLYDLTKKGKLEHKSSVTVTPQKKSPTKVPASPPKPPPTPAIVRRLLNFKRETITDKMKFSNLLKKAIATLSPVQVKHLPEKLKGEFEQRKRIMEERDKMAKMSPAEREAYLTEKRVQAKKIQKQRMLKKLKDQRRRFEDTNLELVPLPQAKLVPTPDCFPNALFGDVAMVTEFINCYGGLLMPDSEYPIHTDALMKALVGGSSGFAYVSRVLTVLLQTLLQDEIAKAYRELNTLMSDIAVSAFTASELVRLCLQCEDEEDDANEVGDMPEEFIKLLNGCEFYQLEVEQKLCLLRGLCSRVLATYSVQDYMEEQQRQASVLMRQKNTEMKQIAAQKKSEKQSGTTERVGSAEDKTQKNERRPNIGDDKQAGKENESKVRTLTISSFYGKDAAEDSGEDSSTWCSVVKHRRLLTAKAAAEKEKMEKEKMALREREYQEEKKQLREKKKQEPIADAINLARMVLRQEPIGTDRNHDRYWVFTNTTPGLYVEKGWVGEEVNYCVRKQSKDETEDETSESEEEEDENSSKNGVDHTNGSHQKPYKARRCVIEKSVPRPGQNLWFTYRSQKDLDGLLKSLHPQGIRESLLMAEIKKNYEDIARAIVQAQRTNLELRTSDGDVEMVSGFKKELSEMELRLRNGGLGGVPDYDEWDTRLMKVSEISALGECLLQVKDGILEKFLQGFMKPASKGSEVQDNENKKESEDVNIKNGGADKEKSPEKDDKREKAIKEWRHAVEECQTMSRLHVLMAVLDSCIKWEKSAENAKCKICSKRCDDACLLLCDECNQAFHMYCLRPALAKLPSGDWFCPACKPRRPHVMSVESESEDEEEKEEICRVCRRRDKLIVCSKCPAAFHTQCCDPPLRHPPRGTWECSDCKNGVGRRQRGKFARKVSSKRSYRQATTPSDTEDEDESEEEDEEDEEEEEEDKEYTTSNYKPSRTKQSRELTSTKKQKTGKVGRPPRSRNSNQADNSGHLTPPIRSSRRGPSELSLCEDILFKVMKHKNSWPFLEPVDKKLVPDYYTLIKKPMDFQTMQKKCLRLSYASPQEFVEDAALVFENAEAYNEPNSEVFTCMREVEKVFKDTLHKLLPDWPYYRTVGEREESSSGSDIGRRRSRNK